MTRSSRSAPNTSPSAPATIVGVALKHWRGGVGVMVFVTTLLAFRGLHAATHVYESQVVFELASGTAGGVVGAENGAPSGDTEQRLEGVLQGALPELDPLRNTAGGGLAPGSAAVRSLLNDRAVLVCRADDAHAAHLRCAKAATTALQKIHALRIVEPASLASMPLPPASDAAFVVLAVSVLIGLIGGALWMLACTIVPAAAQWFVGRSATVRTASRSSPPAVPEAGGAPSKTREPRGPLSDRAGDWPRRKPDSGAKPTGGLEHSPPHGGATRAVVAVSVAGDWAMDASLSEPEPDADLQKLCQQLADLPMLCNQFTGAATVDCFVVGVTSGPDLHQLKSRMAARLAWLLAQRERARVLLLEVDLNHPSLASVMQLAMPPGAGVSQQVQAQLHDDGSAPWTVVRCTPHLSVLAEGRLRTPGVAYLPQFPAALASLRSHFDMIVAHGPAIGTGADASAFTDLVDGIVVAIPTGMADSEALATAARWFSKPILAVANLRAPNLR